MVPGRFRRAAGPFSCLVLYCIGPRLEKKHSGEVELFRNKKTKQKAKHEHTDASPCVVKYKNIRKRGSRWDRLRGGLKPRPLEPDPGHAGGGSHISISHLFPSFTDGPSKEGFFMFGAIKIHYGTGCPGNHPKTPGRSATRQTSEFVLTASPVEKR